MNKDLFYKQIDQPSALSSSDIEPLRELVEQYPYFASARILLAKALHSANDHRFDEALQQAAVFAGDRKMLYDLIMRENLTRAIRDVDTALEADDPEVEVQEEKAEPVAPSSQEIEEPRKEDKMEAGIAETPEVQQPETVEEEPAAVEGDPALHQLTEESKAEQEELPEEKEDTSEPKEEVGEDVSKTEAKKSKDYDELEQEILFEAINSSISQEVDEDAREKRELTPEEKTESEGRENEKEVDVEKELATKPEEETPKTFAGWLKYRAKQIHYYEQVGLEEKQDEAAHSEAVKPGAEEGAEDFEKTEKSEGEKPRQDDLIEKFIEREPKITPKKADMFSSENLAKMSIVEDETFVTETMAKIFARQGNIRKARKAYKLLSLKYPEKSIYFANQIKKLEGKK